MVLGIDLTTVTPGSAGLLSHHTSQPNVFMVGDTITGTAGMDAAAELAAPPTNLQNKPDPADAFKKFQGQANASNCDAYFSNPR